MNATIRLIGVAVAALTVAACQPSAPRISNNSRVTEGAAQSAALAAADVFSVFDLDTTQWTDAFAHDSSARPSPRGASRARPIALAMVYTHCSASCPITVATMRRVEQHMPDSLRYILVSLDPARDNDQQLRAWSTQYRLSPASWSLWHGAERDVRGLAAALGVRYQADAAGKIAHSNIIFLLDAQGVLRQRFSGSTDPAEMAVAARALFP